MNLHFLIGDKGFPRSHANKFDKITNLRNTFYQYFCTPIEYNARLLTVVRSVSYSIFMNKVD